jgi:type II secretory pathway pseudopilin PulG
MQKAEGRKPAAASRAHASRFTYHASRGFTMIEIALSLAIIGFALIAIIGVLPIGMNAQKDNREATIINQDATMWINAIRSGAQGMDDLTNYVMAITNSVTECNADGSPRGLADVYAYTAKGSWRNGAPYSPYFPITNGLRIVGLLSTPKYFFNAPRGGFFSNHVVAYVRSMSGAASDKFPQDNQIVQDLAFSYRMTSEVIPYWTNYFDPRWTGDPAYNAALANLQANLHDVRLLFRWPLRTKNQVGLGGQAFRTLVGGNLMRTNEPGIAHALYLFESRNYTNTNIR